MKRSNLKSISLASLSASISAVALLATANVAMADELEGCAVGNPCTINIGEAQLEGACGDLEGTCVCAAYAEGGTGIFQNQAACIEW